MKNEKCSRSPDWCRRVGSTTSPLTRQTHSYTLFSLDVSLIVTQRGAGDGVVFLFPPLSQPSVRLSLSALVLSL